MKLVEMRALIQRVQEAKVAIAGATHASIEKGLLVFIGIEEADTSVDAEWLSGKISRLRIFADEEGLMNRSVQDVQGDLLVVSQFTLFASTRKGNRPSYSDAARPEFAAPFFEAFVEQLRADSGRVVRTGVFGADMQVSLINDGPVTIWIDTKQEKPLAG
jgi:D-aminoacyl-tRNA deacylase